MDKVVLLSRLKNEIKSFNPCFSLGVSWRHYHKTEEFKCVLSNTAVGYHVDSKPLPACVRNTNVKTAVVILCSISGGRFHLIYDNYSIDHSSGRPGGNSAL